MADFADRVAKLVAQPDYKPITSRRWRAVSTCRPTITPNFGRRSSGSSRRASSTWPRTRPSAGPSGRA